MVVKWWRDTYIQRSDLKCPKNSQSSQQQRINTTRLTNPMPYRGDYFGQTLHIDQSKKYVIPWPWWYPNIDKDIEELVCSCPSCKRVENEPPKILNHPWSWVSEPMDRIHLDYFGPFYGKNFLIMVDAFNKWCEVEI